MLEDGGVFHQRLRPGAASCGALCKPFSSVSQGLALVGLQCVWGVAREQSRERATQFKEFQSVTKKCSVKKLACTLAKLYISTQ